MNWNEIWNSIKTFFQNNIWNIVTFFAVLIIGLVVVKIALNITQKVMKKTKMQEVTQGFLYHILKFTTMAEENIRNVYRMLALRKSLLQ